MLLIIIQNEIKFKHLLTAIAVGIKKSNLRIVIFATKNKWNVRSDFISNLDFYNKITLQFVTFYNF